MKNYLLALAFLTSGFVSFSQSYQTIYPGRQSLYLSPNWEYHRINNSRMSPAGIEVDSITTEGPFTALHHFNMFRTDYDLCMVPYAKLPNWTGPKTLLSADGRNIFFNQAGDSIIIRSNAALIESWRLTEFKNGDYFEAVVTEKKESTILASTDSFKVITLTLKNSSGSSIPHDFNGKEIVLSKNHGLIRGYDFYKFPSDTASFVLIGISDPAEGKQNLTAKEIFDLNPGDEIHIDDVRNNAPYSGSFRKERRIILSKKVSANQDTIALKVERISYTEYSDYSNDANDYTSKKRDTIVEVITLSKMENLNALPPRAVWQDDHYEFSTFITYTSPYNNRHVKTQDWPSQLFPVDNDTCFNIPILGGMTINPNFYIEGLGGEYYTGGDGLAYFHRLPVYYKKGSEEWGTPIDFDILLSSVPRSETVISSSVSPNPFSGTATIEINNWNKQTYHLQVIDLYGKVVMELSTDESRFEINNDGSLSGAYTYKLLNDNNQVGTGKLMIY